MFLLVLLFKQMKKKFIFALVKYLGEIQPEVFRRLIEANRGAFLR